MRKAIDSGLGILLILGAVCLLGPWGGAGSPAPGPPVAGESRGDPARGARLFRDLDCVRCHTEPRTGQGINVPASLQGAGSRSRAAWLTSYLQDPKPLRFRSEGVLPGLRMPALVTETRDAEDLAALLSTWRDTVLVPPILGAEGWVEDPDDVAEGRVLFDQYQCRGCHSLDGSGGGVGPALDGVGDRRRAAYVAALLVDPDRMIPGTAMEDKDLWEEEARALTAYLMTLRGR